MPKSTIIYDKKFAENVAIITHDVLNSFAGEGDFRTLFPTFKDFWDEIEVQNAYEELWFAQRKELKPVYRFVFKVLTGRN